MAHLHPIHDEEIYTHMTNLMKFLLVAVGDDEDHPLSGQLDLVGDLYI
jgi:HTH-type transcriptional regulator/antitoxin HigA